MPRDFFDLHNDLDVLDEEGVILSDVAAAERHATAEVIEMASASIKEHGHIDLHHFIQIRDEEGAIIARVQFEDVVSFRREGVQV